jgi:hypothetical protein
MVRAYIITDKLHMPYLILCLQNLLKQQQYVLFKKNLMEKNQLNKAIYSFTFQTILVKPLKAQKFRFYGPIKKRKCNHFL